MTEPAWAGKGDVNFIPDSATSWDQLLLPDFLFVTLAMVLFPQSHSFV